MHFLSRIKLTPAKLSLALNCYSNLRFYSCFYFKRTLLVIFQHSVFLSTEMSNGIRFKTLGFLKCCMNFTLKGVNRYKVLIVLSYIHVSWMTYALSLLCLEITFNMVFILELSQIIAKTEKCSKICYTSSVIVFEYLDLQHNFRVTGQYFSTFIFSV